MPLQNRVTPFGDIEAVAARGLFTGNRGIIHDPATRTRLHRRWTSKAWLTCTCDFKGRRRDVMATRSWTELFFLDEATALAAGHRPCFFCRREAAGRFTAAWAKGHVVEPPSAPQMDELLHRQRLENGHKRLHPLHTAPETLPDGTMLAAGGRAFVVAAGELFAWSHEGYAARGQLPAIDGLLTPPATIAALAAGYRPVLHPSLESLPSQLGNRHEA